MDNSAPDYAKEVNETLASKKKHSSALAVVIVVIAVVVAAVFFALCLLRAVFFPYYVKKDQAIRLMRKEYKTKITFDRFYPHGDYDFFWMAGSKDFYANAEGLGDTEIQVTRSEDEETVLDNYLSYAYEEKLDEYFTDVLDDYFPGADIVVNIDHQIWMHETEYLDADDYIEEMDGKQTRLQINYTGECPDKDEIEQAVYQIREDNVNWVLYLSIYLDGEQVMGVNYFPDKEQGHVITYPAYDEAFN